VRKIGEGGEIFCRRGPPRLSPFPDPCKSLGRERGLLSRKVPSPLLNA
jgi:hypothetical protein